MNDDDVVTTSISAPIGTMGYDALANTITVAANTGIVNVGYSELADEEDKLDRHAMCKFTVDHKVTDAELLKLKEVAPDYAKEIKENIARNLARDISHKISYTKKHDKDTDVHHFIGRVWVFSDDELKHLLGIRNV